MKPYTSLLLILFMFGINHRSTAQTDVDLSIIHVLNDQLFEYEQAAETPGGDAFDVTRLEYYLSQFIVVHDGGDTTLFDSTWALVDAGESTTIQLGSADITNVEAVRLHIGVEEEFNHLDPSTYGVGHPLGHQFPSMHWGWTSGYRFAVMEGSGGESLNQTYELHGLGDQNYFEATVTIADTADNGELNLVLFADYTKALTDIDVSSGLIVHDVTDEAQTLLVNFSDHVFSASAELDTAGQGTAVRDISWGDKVQLLENPSTDGSITIRLSNKNPGDHNVVVYDIAGKQVSETRMISTGQSEIAKGLSSGVYLVNIVSSKSGERITKKAIVK